MRTTLRRRFGFDANPLRRGTDRMQTLARVLAMVVLVGGCVGAIVTGSASYRQQRELAHLDDVAGYQTTGRVLSVQVVGGAPDGPHSYLYRIAWQDPQGDRHVENFGDTSLRPLDEDTTTVYVSAHEEASLSPRSDGQSLTVAVADGLTTLVRVVMPFAVAHIAMLVLLDRRRNAAWAKEWAAVEPEWRRRVL